MNSVAGALFAPVAVLPGWLSITMISAVLGVLLLLIFKYTSNQKAIGCIRDKINANLIGAWLFKDSLSVTVKSQLKVFGFSVVEGRKGLVVDEVVTSSAAEQAGLRQGDRVAQVGGVDLRSLGDFETLLKNNLGVYPLSFLIVRGNNGYYIDLP